MQKNPKKEKWKPQQSKVNEQFTTGTTFWSDVLRFSITVLKNTQRKLFAFGLVCVYRPHLVTAVIGSISARDPWNTFGNRVPLPLSIFCIWNCLTMDLRRAFQTFFFLMVFIYRRFYRPNWQLH